MTINHVPTGPLGPFRRLFRSADRVLASAAIAVLALPSIAATDAIESRVDDLVERLDEAREAQHIPGLAYAIVRGDAVLRVGGLGLAEVETGRPVDDRTLFAIGSSTKAFTATLVGIGVDEGVVDWDDPVAEHLPDFDLAVERADGGDDPITFVDVLCHRTGFGRMGILWASGMAERTQMYAAARRAEPMAPFRSTFLYNNVAFAAAGEAIAEAMGTDWFDLVETRLLDPLGMDRSSTDFDVPGIETDLALGYQWKAQESAFEHMPMRNLDAIAPSGAIVSSAEDMARWVRFQLGRGSIDGRRLISEDAHARTWTPEIDIDPTSGYGLGWMITEIDGHRVIHHGGNIDGFFAMVALLPDDDLGLCILGNVSASPLQNGCLSMLVDCVSGDDDAPVADAGPDAAGGDEDLSAYEGAYIADFPPFNGATLTVAEIDGDLTIDVPGQQVFHLDPPGDDGRWPFRAMPAAAQIAFNRDDAGRVVSLELHQGGAVLEAPREGVEIVGEIPIEDLQPYLGTYRLEPAPGVTMEIEAVVKNARLALDIPNQTVFELHPPDDEGKWYFRMTDAIAAEFERDGDDGPVTALVMHQAGQAIRGERIAAAPDGDLPAVAELAERWDLAGRAKALESAGLIRVDMDLRLVNSGIDGSITQWFEGTTRYRTDVRFGPFGRECVAVGDDAATIVSDFQPDHHPDGLTLEQVRFGHPAMSLGDWRGLVDSWKVLRVDEHDGRDVVLIRVERGELPRLTLTFDLETGDVLVADGAILVEHLGMAMPTRSEFSDFRPVEVPGGVIRVPWRSATTDQHTGRTETVVTSIATGQAPPADEPLFDVPLPDAAAALQPAGR